MSSTSDNLQLPTCSDRSDFYQVLDVALDCGKGVEFGTLGVSEGSAGDIGGCLLQVGLKNGGDRCRSAFATNLSERARSC